MKEKRSDSSTSSAESEASGEALSSAEAIDASGLATTTNTPTKSTQPNSEKPTTIQSTLGKSGPVVSQITTFSVLASLVKRLATRGTVKDLKTHVERFSSRLPELRDINNLVFYSWKMSKASSATTKEKPSKLSYGNWGVSDIGLNGRFSILSGSVSPRSVREYSLLDILEENPPEQCYLSEKRVNWILEKLKDPRNSISIVSTPTSTKDQTNTDKEQS